MQLDVEIPLNPHMVEDLGKEAAVARLTFDAWYRTLKETRPTRSLTLISVEERESTQFGPTVRAYRFKFQVD